jgi:23S rRNA U2552 (ribose-2'-O)-methylase RlmE/FtsJ
MVMAEENLPSGAFYIKTHEKEYDNIDLNINLIQSNEPEKPLECYGFNINLNSNRDLIDKINPDIWKKVRWYINEYDFLVKDPIINRAFYKYWEIINEFDIFDKFNLETDCIFHCAEAPGGFIQGSNIYLQLDNYLNKKINQNEKNEPDKDGFIEVKKKQREKKKYKIYTISLNKDLPKYKTYNLPSYNKSILNKHICITFGKDNTGDINNLDNIDYIQNLMYKPSYLVTADGGFDEGNDFNNKEQLHYYLILNEIYTVLKLQNIGGNFILKVFDIFTNTSIHLLYLLNLLYKDIYVYKPKTSRPTNSEKYIICKNFISHPNINSILNSLKNLSHNLNNHNKSETKFCSKFKRFTLFKNIPETFCSKIKYMNQSLLQTQCKYLNEAILLCQNTSFIEQYDTELQKSLEKRREIFLEWEYKYNLNSYIPG